jgi:hypothetical protein
MIRGGKYEKEEKMGKGVINLLLYFVTNDCVLSGGKRGI